MNNTISETKDTLEGMYSRIIESEEWLSEMLSKMVETTGREQRKKKMKRIKDKLIHLWDNIKCTKFEL